VTSPIPPQSDKCECGGKLFQRDDDQPEQIKLRLREYRKNTEPLLDLFKKEGLLFEINGERPILEIQADLVKEIKSRQK
jgi:adenylate kinase